MFAWLVVEGEHAGLLSSAMGRGWQGGAGEAVELALPARRDTRALVFAWADPSSPPSVRRPPRWPELLREWSEIYEEALFPGDVMPVLAEEMSALGADALLIHAAPGLAGATVAWYERGALIQYEHVGGATVAWSEVDGLGRPIEGGVRGVAASAARKLGGDELILDRIEQSARATGEALIERALHRFLAADPPPFDELSGLVARARPQRFGAR